MKYISPSLLLVSILIIISIALFGVGSNPEYHLINIKRYAIIMLGFAILGAAIGILVRIHLNARKLVNE